MTKFYRVCGLSLCALALSFSGYAQYDAEFQEASASEFKPTNNFTLDIGFLKGTGAGPTQIVSIESINARLFTTAQFALRARLNFKLDRSVQDNGLSGSNLQRNVASVFELGLEAGFEKHLTGTKRLSPYFGALVGFNSVSVNETIESGDDIIEYVGTNASQSMRGSFSFLLTGVAGVNFYVAKHLYLGAEFGFGLELRSDATVEVIENNDTQGEPDEGGTRIIFGEQTTSALILGWCF